MAYSQTDLANIQKAISKGARSVQIDGERVDFQTLDDMLRIERKIKAALGEAKPRRRMIYPKTTTGFR